MELDCETVEVANVQRAKIMMKGVVQEGVVNGEVAWRSAAAAGLSGGLRRPLRPFPGADRGLGVREIRLVSRRVDVRCEI